MSSGFVCWFDSPKVLDCSVTPIPASSASTLEVVASLDRDTTEIHAIFSISNFVGLYVGPSGHEVLVCIIGGNSPFNICTVIQAGSRISLRNMTNQTISLGSFCAQFIWGKI